MLPAPTARLRFREMTEADVVPMATLLGDPAVMAYYPAPKTPEEAALWIAGNRTRYLRDGHGLWIIETHEGAFLGDCGLTWQSVNGERRLEVGYHVRTDRQGRGYATEAAAACRDLARERALADELVAIVHPENTASLRVAEKIGMTHVDGDVSGMPAEVFAALGIASRTVMGMPLT